MGAGNEGRGFWWIWGAKLGSKIEGALDIMHVWSCVMEHEVNVTPSSYIDDSIFLATEPDHLQPTAHAFKLDLESNDFAGTVGNQEKTLF